MLLNIKNPCRENNMNKSNRIIIILLALGVIFAGYQTISLESESAPYDPVTSDPQQIDTNFPPAFHEIFIPINTIKLTGFILTANGAGPHPTVVLMHGLPGNEKNLDLAQSMRRAGFNVLFFHYRGSWGSQGDYSFKTIHEDGLAAINFLRSNAEKYHVDSQNISIMGHSFGGYAALRAGSEDNNLTCVVGLSAANPAVIASSDRVKNDFNQGIGPYIDELFMLRNFPGKQAVEELLNNADVMDTRNFGEGLKGKNVLLVVGSEDNVTPAVLQKQNVENYSKIEGLNVESFIIPGDHAYSVSRIALQHLVVNWLGKKCR
jgi:hypothetical protein